MMRRRGSIATVIALAIAIAISGTTSAQALTSLEALKHPGNAWIAADLASVAGDTITAPGPAIITDPDGKLPPVLYDNDNRGRAVPTAVGRTASTTIVPKRLPSSKIGLILNTGVALLGIGGMLFANDGSDAVEYTGPIPAPTNTQARPGWLGPAEGQHDYLLGQQGHRTSWRNVNVVKSGTNLVISMELMRSRYDGTALTGNAETWAVIRRQCANGTGTPIDSTFGPSTIGANSWATATSNVGPLPVGTCPAGGGTLAGTRFSIRFGTTANNILVDFRDPALDTPSGPLPVPVTTRVECIDANGAITVKNVTQDLIIAPGQTWTPPNAECPAGQVAGSGEVTATWGGQTTTMIPRVDASPEVKALPSKGVDVSGNTIPQLEVDTRTDPNGQPQWKTCAVAPAFCEPDLRTETRTDVLARFRCMMNGIPVDLRLCKVTGTNPAGEQVVRLPIPTAAPPTIGGNPSTSVCPPEVSFTSFITGRLVYDALVCAAKYLFVPTDMTAWADDAQSIASKPPVSFFITAKQFWDELGTTTACIQTESCADRAFVIGDAAGIVQLDPFAYVVEQSSAEWMIRLRQLGIFATYCAVVWWTVNRISNSFGGKTATA